MVLLTVTPAIVRALEAAEAVAAEDFGELQLSSEPSLAAPAVGQPVSHGQLIDLSRLLRKHEADITAREEKARRCSQEEESITARQDSVEPLQADKSTQQQPLPAPRTLDALLRGSSIYIPPPPPKKPQTTEYKALMARLRAEEEARAYERMLNPSAAPTSYLPKSETFSQRFQNASSPPAFSVGTQTATDEDELSYDEVHRQIILIINVLVSVVACAVFIWMAARHWSAPTRLGLSMGGSGAVAIAEVVVYSSYVRKVAEAKRKERRKPEIKEIVQSWVIDSSDKKAKEVSISSATDEKSEDAVRYRKGKHR
ncbi:hypothetical protein CC80DRAFT_497601 [Byssothecium circinans]|uniref:Uncharacterized protein n=1 Tax=Byssothecium circinans TaxID=147558 RepID=A0A6A5T8K5_9PLEO|nr:hypothetical protein CC80DRAFT_497601 [Byssothecium circinans]